MFLDLRPLTTSTGNIQNAHQHKACSKRGFVDVTPLHPVLTNSGEPHFTALLWTRVVGSSSLRGSLYLMHNRSLPTRGPGVVQKAQQRVHFTGPWRLRKQQGTVTIALGQTWRWGAARVLRIVTAANTFLARHCSEHLLYLLV